MQIDVITLEGKKTGSMDLSTDTFGLENRGDLLQRAVLWQQAKKRAGTASTLTRGEIGRTTKRVYRQKGTGGARHGSRRVNLFKGGGIVFGPKPRSFAKDLPKKVRTLALKTALSVKANGKSLVVLDAAATKTHKTKDLVGQLTKLELTNSLFIVDSMDDNFDKASRNLPHVKVIPTEGANVYDILRADKLVLTKASVEMLQARLNSRATKDTAPAEKAPAKKAAPKKAAAKPAAKKPAAKKAPAKKAAAKKES